MCVVNYFFRYVFHQKNMNTSIALNNSISLSACTGLNIIGDQNVQGIFGGGTPVISNEGDPEIIIIPEEGEDEDTSNILYVKTCSFVNTFFSIITQSLPEHFDLSIFENDFPIN